MFQPITFWYLERLFPELIMTRNDALNVVCYVHMLDVTLCICLNGMNMVLLWIEISQFNEVKF